MIDHKVRLLRDPNHFYLRKMGVKIKLAKKGRKKDTRKERKAKRWLTDW